MLKLAHKNLEVWKKSIFLIKSVYQITDQLPDEEKYNLISQMRRSVISVSSNIAEGFSRFSIQEKKRFIEISRSSLVELDTHFETCIQLGYLNISELNKIDKLLNHIFAMLTKLYSRIR